MGNCATRTRDHHPVECRTVWRARDPRPPTGALGHGVASAGLDAVRAAGEARRTTSCSTTSSSNSRVLPRTDQQAKGSVEFLSTGEALIRALANPDVSTGIHERRTSRADGCSTAPSRRTARRHHGQDIVTGRQVGGGGAAWTAATNGREAEEKFARGRTLRRKAPTPLGSCSISSRRGCASLPVAAGLVDQRRHLAGDGGGLQPARDADGAGRAVARTQLEAERDRLRAERTAAGQRPLRRAERPRLRRHREAPHAGGTGSRRANAITAFVTPSRRRRLMPTAAARAGRRRAVVRRRRDPRVFGEVDAHGSRPSPPRSRRVGTRRT